jgi:hypothetical protein
MTFNQQVGTVNVVVRGGRRGGPGRQHPHAGYPEVQIFPVGGLNEPVQGGVDEGFPPGPVFLVAALQPGFWLPSNFDSLQPTAAGNWGQPWRSRLTGRPKGQ